MLMLYRRIQRRRSRRWPAQDLRRSAVVFSPHFDDETLGCGGTVIQKRRAGADVSIVFMTDGSTSHQAQMPATDLRRLRAAEGLAAGRALGLRSEDILLLGFQEGRLRDHEAEAVDRVTEILRQRRPEEVYMPYQGEPLLWSEDHQTATRVVRAALARCGGRVTVHEYPIWFYRQWPWTSWSGCGWEKRVFLKLAFLSPLGSGVIWRLPCCRDVADVLDQKRAALAEHRSQMQPLLDRVGWPTLSDVAGGTFLQCFLCEYEVFRSYSVNLQECHSAVMASRDAMMAASAVDGLEAPAR
jgi:LmbE family N-acetylglucosaminyl deacetylase